MFAFEFSTYGRVGLTAFPRAHLTPRAAGTADGDPLASGLPGHLPPLPFQPSCLTLMATGAPSGPPGSPGGHTLHPLPPLPPGAKLGPAAARGVLGAGSGGGPAPKRARHHTAGGSGPHAAPTATQVRRMSLRLGNLDLGSGEEGEGPGVESGVPGGGAEAGKQQQQQRGADGPGGSVAGGEGGLAGGGGADGARGPRASLMGIDMDVEAEDAEADVGSSNEEEEGGTGEEGHSGGWVGGVAAADDPMGLQLGPVAPGAVDPPVGHAMLGQGSA